MAIFNSYVKLPEGKGWVGTPIQMACWNIRGCSSDCWRLAWWKSCAFNGARCASTQLWHVFGAAAPNKNLDFSSKMRDFTSKNGDRMYYLLWWVVEWYPMGLAMKRMGKFKLLVVWNNLFCDYILLDRIIVVYVYKQQSIYYDKMLS